MRLTWCQPTRQIYSTYTSILHTTARAYCVYIDTDHPIIAVFLSLSFGYITQWTSILSLVRTDGYPTYLFARFGRHTNPAPPPQTDQDSRLSCYCSYLAHLLSLQASFLNAFPAMTGDSVCSINRPPSLIWQADANQTRDADSGAPFKSFRSSLPQRPRRFYLPCIVILIVIRLEVLQEVVYDFQCTAQGVEVCPQSVPRGVWSLGRLISNHPPTTLGLLASFSSRV